MGKKINAMEEMRELRTIEARMFIHCSMLMSIKDACKTWGWTVSKNWIIK